eukprot:TRINITY_DN1192_c0_g1_i6.p1 TRINITY_DN1192_c0_g1~~TRINITY_DN1192_c0_g1_i6.p1  ORF type:complete len:1414 (+),score=315.12 TRINITY_DN1192_c0_g1_i6:491-4243(+)
MAWANRNKHENKGAAARVLSSVTRAMTGQDVGENSGEAMLSLVRNARSSLVTGWAAFLAEAMLGKRGHARPFPRFSQCAVSLSEGCFPIPICTAINSGKPTANGGSSGLDASSSTSSGVKVCAAGNWTWVDVTPFTVRKGGALVKPTVDMDDESIPFLMGVCGSAFAFDWQGFGLPFVQEKLPLFLQRYAVPNSVWTNQREPVIESFFHALRVTASDSDVGEMRDAGIDFNIPLPALRGRGVDLVLVIDASEGMNSCEHLASAVARGHASVREQDRPLLTAPFARREVCRVFQPAREGDPVIFYFHGNNAVDTLCFDYSPERVEGICGCIRRAVTEEADTVRDELRRRWRANMRRAAAAADRAASANSASSFLPSCTATTSRGAAERAYVRDALQVHYKKLYEHMAFLDTKLEPRAFDEMFVPLSLAAGGCSCSDWSDNGCAVSLENVWEAAARERTTRCVLGGCAGSGKSTLCRWLAREQGTPVGWDRYFAAVLLIELGRTDRAASAAGGNGPMFASTEALLRTVLPPPLRTDELLLDFIIRNQDRILWIFDDFSEAEAAAKGPFKEWLVSLERGEVSWAKWTVFASRHERKAPFRSALIVELEPWTQRSVRVYVNKFFTGGEYYSGASAAHGRKCAMALLDDHPLLAGLAASAPLLCELLCGAAPRVARDAASCAGGEPAALRALLESLLEWLWCRAKAKRRMKRYYAYRADASRRLQELALQAYRDNKPTFPLNPHDDAEFLALRSGLVRSVEGSAAGLCESHGPSVACEFVHATLRDWLVARGLWEGNAGFALLTLAPRERSVLMALAGFARGTGKWRDAFDAVASAFLAKLHLKRVEFEREMTAGIGWYATRDKWREKLGLGLAVEFASALGFSDADRDPDKKTATDVLMERVLAVLPNGSGVGPALDLKKLLHQNVSMPFELRLMLEPAAQFGNVPLLHFLLKRAGPEPRDEVEQALVSAYTAGQHEVEHLLQRHNAGDVTAEAAARVGHSGALRALLARAADQRATAELALMAALGRDQADVIEPLAAALGAERVAIRALASGDSPHCAEAALRLCGGRLESIDLSYMHNVKDASLIAIGGWCAGMVRDLNLRCCPGVTDAGVAAACGPSLRVLSLADCPQLTDAGVAAVARVCVQIERLDLTECKFVGDLTLLALSESCPALVVLDATNCKKVTDAGVCALAAGCPKLASLTLTHCVKLTDATLRALAEHCPRLTRLSVAGCRKITAEALSKLSDTCEVSWQ